MKKITLPDITFSVAGRDGTVTSIGAAEQLRLLVSFAPSPNEPLTLDDIRRRLPILDKLEALDGKKKQGLVLEDAEYAVLQAVVAGSVWTGVNRDAIALADAVEGAETVEVKTGT